MHRCRGPWVGAFSYGYTERGTPKRYTVKGDSEAQVRVRLRKRMGEVLEAGGASAGAKVTVKQWADDWLEIVERTLRPQPFTNARSAVRKWIVPAIGHRRLSELTPADVRKVSARQREQGLASSSQRRNHSVLVTMLKAARADGHAVPGIVVEVPAPKTKRSNRKDLPIESAMRVLSVAADLPHGSRWLTAVLQGPRQGEALGLRWADVDFDRHVLRISWQLQPLPYRVPYDRGSGFRVPDDYESVQLEGRWHLVRPKTDAGWRVVPMIPWVEEALLAWREIAPASPHGLVWPGPSGGPRTPKDDDAEWYALQREVGARWGTPVEHPAGRPYSVHEARHTTATLLMEAGVPTAVIVAIVGHSSMMSLQSYLHVNTDAMVAALGKVALRLGGGAEVALA